MQYPARMLPGGRRFFFPRRLRCFWTWKAEKFQVAYQVFLDTAALKFLKLSWRFVRTTQMWSASSNYRRNGVGGCCSSKWQPPLLAALVSMSWKSRMSTASVMEGLVLGARQCWGEGDKNHSFSYLFWRAISALQHSLMSYAVTTCSPSIWHCHGVMKFSFAQMTKKSRPNFVCERRRSQRLLVVGPG